ncbi:MAG: 23S rRNA (pseudouridine(1915)-N(3))-methyltransferase RlmH [Owenweeksia sp.]
MKILLIETGKTRDINIQNMVQDYYNRINHYLVFTIKTIPDLKNTRNLSTDQVKQKEAEMILKEIQPSDHVVLLDENGRQRTSVDFAGHLQNLMNRGLKQTVFIIGGAYGFDPSVYGRANEKIGLSRMTFSHQIIRPIFTEQLYRAFTILRNEPYHHQ